MWQLSIRSKIILVLLLTGLVCLAAGAVIGYLAGEAALTQSIESRLTVLRDISAVAEARHQAILPLDSRLRIVA